MVKVDNSTDARNYHHSTQTTFEASILRSINHIATMFPLPVELILEVAAHLPTLGALNAFMQANRHTYYTLHDELYRAAADPAVTWPDPDGEDNHASWRTHYLECTTARGDAALARLLALCPDLPATKAFSRARTTHASWQRMQTRRAHSLAGLLTLAIESAQPASVAAVMRCGMAHAAWKDEAMELAVAAGEPSAAVVRALVEGGAPVNTRCRFRGYAPLRYAIACADSAVVATLLALGADTEGADGDGCAPLRAMAKACDSKRGSGPAAFKPRHARKNLQNFKLLVGAGAEMVESGALHHAALLGKACSRSGDR